VTGDPPPGGEAAGRPAPPDPAALLAGLVPGLDWSRALVEGPLRAQAALAADTLGKLNAPLVDALRWQRELAASLGAAADQLSALARQLEHLAGQHQALSEQLEAALEPYLRYVDWLGEAGSGGRGS
jgi:ABC-type transporter Mla subunit MlaD